jgi:hypothetical protein
MADSRSVHSGGCGMQTLVLALQVNGPRHGQSMQQLPGVSKRSAKCHRRRTAVPPYQPDPVLRSVGAAHVTYYVAAYAVTECGIRRACIVDHKRRHHVADLDAYVDVYCCTAQ